MARRRPGLARPGYERAQTSGAERNVRQMAARRDAARRAERLAAKECTNCGEPEDGGQFGWFDHETDGLRCNSCGMDPKETR